MPAPGEHKTVQARILAYAQAIGWRYVPCAEAEKQRAFDFDGATAEDCARPDKARSQNPTVYSR